MMTQENEHRPGTWWLLSAKRGIGFTTVVDMIGVVVAEGSFHSPQCSAAGIFPERKHLAVQYAQAPPSIILNVVRINHWIIGEKTTMGMFDTVYAELDCPFCGKQYRYSPLTSQQAAQALQEGKQWQIETREKHLRGEKETFNMQNLWAEQEGFDDVDKWIDQLDSPDNIEAHRTRPHLGLAEIQTKEFDKTLKEFYVGDEVPKYSGHYFIPESFECDGCSSSDEDVYVKVWLEIEERMLKDVLTRDPETGKPAREVFEQAPPKPREPDPHPALHFKHRGIQAQARYNSETEMYDLEVHYLPERFSLSHPNTDLLREVFTAFAEGYLYLLGKGPEEKESLHEHLLAICRHLPSDYQPYGQRERTGPDCSVGYKHYLKLPGKLGMDWGVCANPDSSRAGLLTFEHQGCEQFEA